MSKNTVHARQQAPASRDADAETGAPVARLDDACFQWFEGDRLCRSEPINLRLWRGDILSIGTSDPEQASAFVALLRGRQPPVAGSYFLEEHRLDAMNEADRRALLLGRVGVCGSGSALLPHFDALGNVTLPLLVNGMARSEAVARARVEMSLLQIATLSNTLPARLTARQTALVRLAGAIVHRPALLICEYPERNLIGAEIATVRRRLFALSAQDGVSIVLLTNHPQFSNLAAMTVWPKEALSTASASRSRRKRDPEWTAQERRDLLAR